MAAELQLPAGQSSCGCTRWLSASGLALCEKGGTFSSFQADRRLGSLAHSSHTDVRQTWALVRATHSDNKPAPTSSTTSTHTSRQHEEAGGSPEQACLARLSYAHILDALLAPLIPVPHPASQPAGQPQWAQAPWVRQNGRPSESTAGAHWMPASRQPTCATGQLPNLVRPTARLGALPAHSHNLLAREEGREKCRRMVSHWRYLAPLCAACLPS